MRVKSRPTGFVLLTVVALAFLSIYLPCSTVLAVWVVWAAWVAWVAWAVWAWAWAARRRVMTRTTVS